ncbi:YHS domain-containing (seleno)protein [Tritonibacter scottomollicae]|uniref:YHS domain-containing (Seleno)protein n=1 Tax=Tritonibacter scottomollicae TaxID=483013 RepID=A0ABZ0HFD7_TRISK|nr:YHS domain-containing (seleno)protein [Tritonibacter scottomollicae]WOI33550.1 YHS domain-containing (seleno)protein [Tritonibacter scottomollicae]
MLHLRLKHALTGFGFAIFVGTALTLSPASRAQADTIYISMQDGIAIGGYDPVSFHTADQPKKGAQDHALMWKGAVWLFHTAHNQSRFEANPRAYAPKFGGHCAYGIARGRVFDGNPMTWEIVDGHLYLFHTPRVEALWMAERTHMIQTAHQAWPDVLDTD